MGPFATSPPMDSRFRGNDDSGVSTFESYTACLAGMTYPRAGVPRGFAYSAPLVLFL